MKDSKPVTVFIFVGLLLVIIFVVGLVCTKNPAAFQTKYRYDYTLDWFCSFCADWWLPAGIIGIPMMLISVIFSLRKGRNKE